MCFVYLLARSLPSFKIKPLDTKHKENALQMARLMCSATDLCCLHANNSPTYVHRERACFYHSPTIQ